ncbi:MAG: VanZ family protein [Dysgonamonadaceae bacterium]|jgi:VanZ family protein|nr:VanZ family protein [Dysgonamonadaceae bacterium]
MKSFFIAFVLFGKKYFISIFLNVAILFLCFIKTDSMPPAPVENTDKIVHFLMFMILSLTLFFDNTRYFRRKISHVGIVLWSLVFPALLGGLIEIMQENLTTYRSGDLMDFLFDGIGAFSGMIICFLINCKLKFPAQEKIKDKN